MKILVDADACPVKEIIVREAKARSLRVIMVCDTAHEIRDGYSETVTVDKGADSADLKLISLGGPGDTVVTQDYGVAAMALGKGAYAIHHTGKRYTDDNIDIMLMERHFAKKARRASGKHHLRGPAKYTEEDRQRFCAAFEELISLAVQALGGNTV